MDQQVTVVTDLEMKDVQELNLVYTRVSRMMLAFAFFIVFIGIVLLVEGQRNAGDLMVILIMDVIISIILWFVNQSSIRKRSGKAYLSDKLIRQRYTFLLNGQGVRYESASETGRMRWSDIYKVRETANLFLILLSTSRSLIIPKESFGSMQDQTAFKQIVAANLDQSQIQWRRRAPA